MHLVFLHLFDSWKIHNNSTLLCQDFGVFSWKAKVYSKLKMYITVEMPSRVMSGSSCWRAIIITICSLTKETVRRSVKLRLTRVKLLENYSTPIYMHSLIHRGALKNLLWNFLIYHLYSNLSLLTLFFFEGCSTLFRNWIFYPHEIQQEPIYCFYNQLLFLMIETFWSNF